MNVCAFFKGLLLKKKIIKTFKNTSDKEILEMLDTIKERGVSYFNYKWFVPENVKVDVLFDDELKRNYVVYNNNKMFFKKDWNEQKIKEYCAFLFLEQDEKSPHRYLDSNIEAASNIGVIVDAGGAEGSFALSIIDKAKKIYILECDDEWIEALKLTFMPYKDRVVIVKRYLTDNNIGENITLDELLKNDDNVSLIKMDIEGAEVKACKGAKKTISNNQNVIVLACSYHYQDEERELRKALENLNMIVENRKGYIYFLHDENQKYPFFRRGVLKAYRNIKGI